MTRPYLPENVDVSGRYLFYLHGGIIQEQGIDAVSEYYGRYEYLAILDTLEAYGFLVISEARPKGTEEGRYAQKVAAQIDTLLQEGVAPEKIIVLGASLGAYIAVETAHQLQNARIRYALLGLCSDYALDFFSKYRNELPGDFLSIFEKSDQKGSCRTIFTGTSTETKFEEVELNMGIDHAFLYQPYKEWVLPLVEWAKR